MLWRPKRLDFRQYCAKLRISCCLRCKSSKVMKFADSPELPKSTCCDCAVARASRRGAGKRQGEAIETPFMRGFEAQNHTSPLRGIAARPPRDQKGGTMGSIDAMDTQITVALVGGNRLRDQCLAQYLETNGFNTIKGVKDNLRETLVDPAQAPDLVLIDTGSHTCTDPEFRRVLASLREALPAAPVAVLSDREDWSAVYDAFDFGVRAYFPSSLDPGILLTGIRLLRTGGSFIPVDVLGLEASRHRRRTQSTELARVRRRALTPSEHRVLELLTKAYSNKLIARELSIEECTVKVHVRRNHEEAQRSQSHAGRPNRAGDGECRSTAHLRETSQRLPSAYSLLAAP